MAGLNQRTEHKQKQPIWNVSLLFPIEICSQKRVYVYVPLLTRGNKETYFCFVSCPWFRPSKIYGFDKRKFLEEIVYIYVRFSN
jgi:hypothetical protein